MQRLTKKKNLASDTVASRSFMILVFCFDQHAAGQKETPKLKKGALATRWIKIAESSSCCGTDTKNTRENTTSASSNASTCMFAENQGFSGDSMHVKTCFREKDKY